MADFLNRDEALLLVVDVQARLVPAIHKELYPRALRNTLIMIEAADTLGLPIILTEQYPQGLGPTVPEIIKALDGKKYERHEKVSFSCVRDEAFLRSVATRRRKQVVMAGMETHVCVYQTAVDLRRAGYSVFVLDDAVSSRALHNYESGLQSMRDAGCVVFSTETAVFELLKVAGTPEFKKLSALVR